MVKALARFVEAQTALYAKKWALKAQDIDVYEEGADDEMRSLKDLTADQVFIETLSIDDCRMRDEDLAVLLRAIAKQGRLRCLTIANNDVGDESATVLADILGQKYRQQSHAAATDPDEAKSAPADADPFFPYSPVPLESLNLTNLKCGRS